MKGFDRPGSIVVSRFRVSCDWFGLAYFAAVLAAGGGIVLRPELAPWPLLVAPVFWLLRVFLARTGNEAGSSSRGLDAFILVFLATAAMSLWVTYDRSLGMTDFGPAGAYKFWLLVAAALVYDATKGLASKRALWVASAGFGAIGMLTAGSFLLTHNFSTPGEDFVIFHRLGLMIQSFRPDFGLLPFVRPLHPNVAGGVSAALLLLTLDLYRVAWRLEYERVVRIVFLTVIAISSLIMAAGVLFSSSRGAWGGLVVALGGWTAFWVIGRFKSLPAKTSAPTWRTALFLITIAAAAIVAFALVPRFFGVMPPFQGGQDILVSRLDVMRDSLLLIAMAPFTGTGLGTFPMIYSTYVLLIHVPFLPHAHNVYLNVLIAQGVLGLLAYLSAITFTLILAYRVRQHAPEKWPLDGAVAMLVASLVHGLIDDPFYSSQLVLVWFAPLGLVAAAARMEGVSTDLGVPTRVWLGAGVASLLIAGGVMGARPAASLLTNLGFVRQAQAELIEYRPGRIEERTLDQVRTQIDLTEAERYYSQALRMQADHRSANLQLAGLQLSWGEFDQALVYASRAWAAGHRDRITRLIYGSALVAKGRPQAAAEAMYGLAWADTRLNGEAWYRYYRSGDFRRAADAYRALLLLNPNNDAARHGLAEAEMRLR